MNGQRSVDIITSVVSGLFISNSLLQVPNIFNDVDTVTDHYTNVTNYIPDFVISLLTMLVLVIVSDQLKVKLQEETSAGNQMLICHMLMLILSLIAYNFANYFQIGNTTTWMSMMKDLKFKCATTQIIMITICFLVYKHIERLRK